MGIRWGMLHTAAEGRAHAHARQRRGHTYANNCTRYGLLSLFRQDWSLTWAAKPYRGLTMTRALYCLRPPRSASLSAADLVTVML